MAEIKDILNIYEKEIRKNMKNKFDVLEFEKKKMKRISEIKNKIEHLDECWKVRYQIFLIHKPKARVIMALDNEKSNNGL